MLKLKNVLMKANGFRLIIYRAILLVLLSLYFILVFGQVPDSSNYFQQVKYTITSNQSLPKLLTLMACRLTSR